MQSNKKADSEAIALALQNAQEYSDHPIFTKDHQYHTYELFLGIQEWPAYVNIAGQAILIDVPTYRPPIIQEFVDGECVYIELFGVEELNRWGECKRPPFGIDAIEGKAQSLIAQKV